MEVVKTLRSDPIGPEERRVRLAETAEKSWSVLACYIRGSSTEG